MWVQGCKDEALRVVDLVSGTPWLVTFRLAAGGAGGDAREQLEHPLPRVDRLLPNGT